MRPEPNTPPTCDECARLRTRIREIQIAADRRNADLHRRVAYYESIRERTNEMLDRFKREVPVDDGYTSSRRFIEWFTDTDHTRPFVTAGRVLPGSEVAFWIAFRMVLEASLPLDASPEPHA